VLFVERSADGYMGAAGESLRGSDVRKKMQGTASLGATRRTGPPLVPLHMYKSRFNVTLRDSQADGLPVAAIPSEGVTRCGILCIDDHQFMNVRQDIFFKSLTVAT
jgi:hypothetical protein